MSEKTKDEWDRPSPGHVIFCANNPDGPVFKLSKRMDAMEARVTAIETDHIRERGAREEDSKKTVRAVQYTAIVVGALSALNFILDHWPNK